MPATITLASPRQRTFVQDLLRERVVPDSEAASTAREFAAGADIPGTLARSIITWLLSQPTVARAPAPDQQGHVPQAGSYYLRDGIVYRLFASKGSPGRCYAKALRLPMTPHGRASWAYAPGVFYSLLEHELLTVEEAAALGHLHGICVVCGARLDDPASVERGIGPVCYRKLGGR